MTKEEKIKLRENKLRRINPTFREKVIKILDNIKYKFITYCNNAPTLMWSAFFIGCLILLPIIGQIMPVDENVPFGIIFLSWFLSFLINIFIMAGIIGFFAGILYLFRIFFDYIPNEIKKLKNIK